MAYYTIPPPLLDDIDTRSLITMSQDIVFWTGLRKTKSEHANFGYTRRRELSYSRIFSSTLGELWMMIPDIKRQLKRLRSTFAKFKDCRTHCRNRHFSQQWKHLEQYLYIVLDFESIDASFEPGGGVEQALHEAEQLLAAPWVLPGVADLTISSDYQQARKLFERLSAYQRLLELDYRTVKSQLRQLRSVEDALDEEDRQREIEQRQYEVSMERLARFIRQVAIRLQVNLEFLLLLCKSSKFPDGDEPGCTTMPWNILPALIVLWGVCWMFYGFSGLAAVQCPSGIGNDEVPGIGKFRHRTRALMR